MPRLTKERILSEALALLDEVGTEALTMRRLADQLGVQAGALYWHYPNKQSLVAAMAEEMLTDTALQADGEPEKWRARIVEQLMALRRALLAHRDGARVFAGTFVAEPNTLTLGEVLLGALRDAGLGKREAAWSCSSLVHFVIGFVVEEQAAQGFDPATLTSQVDRERYPNIAAVKGPFTSQDFDARMKFGLNLMLDGIERGLESRGASSGGRTRRA
ncbi:TetR/AcrR family transcriptional regulator C-terminal domain-containing protein [Pendulispora brunnea]|uniref:TetR/AcrR family transcriptional regulator C-terminal domain-containing protein n=1 Tax=Pendulispora brunnea TaxID=2905690 RepID=A0ABZ2KA06_9BACT